MGVVTLLYAACGEGKRCRWGSLTSHGQICGIRNLETLGPRYDGAAHQPRKFIPVCSFVPGHAGI